VRTRSPAKASTSPSTAAGTSTLPGGGTVGAYQPSSLPFIQENSVSMPGGSSGAASSSTAAGSRNGTLKKLSLSKKASMTPTTPPSAAASRPSNFNRPLFHLPHQSKSKQLWQKVFEASVAAGSGSGHQDEPDGFPKITHMKQNSYDSGIHHGSSESASDWKTILKFSALNNFPQRHIRRHFPDSFLNIVARTSKTLSFVKRIGTRVFLKGQKDPCMSY